MTGGHQVEMWTMINMNEHFSCNSWLQGHLWQHNTSLDVVHLSRELESCIFDSPYPLGSFKLLELIYDKMPFAWFYSKGNEIFPFVSKVKRNGRDAAVIGNLGFQQMKIIVFCSSVVLLKEQKHFCSFISLFLHLLTLPVCIQSNKKQNQIKEHLNGDVLIHGRASPTRIMSATMTHWTDNFLFSKQLWLFDLVLIVKEGNHERYIN